MTSKPGKNSSTPSPSLDPHGVKHDQDKLRYDLVSIDWEEELANVMTYGAAKYGERNWEKGILVSRLYAAHRRHLKAFMSGEEYDRESGLHHLGHANACLMMMYKLSRELAWDDREVLHDEH